MIENKNDTNDNIKFYSLFIFMFFLKKDQIVLGLEFAHKGTEKLLYIITLLMK